MSSNNTDTKLSLIASPEVLNSVFLAGTPHVLSTNSVSFSSDEIHELLAIDVAISGKTKNLFWLYDHQTNSFDANSLNSQLASKLYLSADDITISASTIAGSGSQIDYFVSYKIDNENQTKLAILKSDGSFVEDLIESSTNEIAQHDITKIEVVGDFVVIETLNALSQIENGAPLGVAELILDDNQSRDIYAIDTQNQTVKFISQLAGQTLSGNSNLVDATRNSEGLQVLINTTAALSTQDENGINDHYLVGLDAELNNASIAFLNNQDGTFFNTGSSTAKFFNGNEVIFASDSSNVTNAGGGNTSQLYTYKNSSGEVSKVDLNYFDNQTDSAFSLSEIELLDASSKSGYVLFSALGSELDTTPQAYLLHRGNEVDTITLISQVDGLRLGSNDGIYSGTVSDFGTAASMQIESPTWVGDQSFSGLGIFSVSDEHLSQSIININLILSGIDEPFVNIGDKLTASWAVNSAENFLDENVSITWLRDGHEISTGKEYLVSVDDTNSLLGFRLNHFDSDGFTFSSSITPRYVKSTETDAYVPAVSDISGWNFFAGDDTDNAAFGESYSVYAGRTGADFFEGQSSTSNVVFLGGKGGDHFRLAQNDAFVMILDVDDGSSNTFEFSGISLDHQSSYFFTVNNNEHLFLGDTVSRQNALLVDWQTSGLDASSLVLAGNMKSIDSFSTDLPTLSNYLGDFTWSGAAEIFETRTSQEFLTNPEAIISSLSAWSNALAINKPINQIFTGTNDEDSLMGGAGDDLLEGGDGNDHINGGVGNDYIDGGLGNDNLTSNQGADRIIGGSGDDTIHLSSPDIWTFPYFAKNIATGERLSLAGKTKFSSVIDGEGDADTLNLTDSTAGDAFFLHDSYSGLHDSLTAVDDGMGRTTVARAISLETINAGDGDDVIDLTSPTFDVGGIGMTINGEAGDDTIWAAEGDDELYGGDDDDILFGGEGNDILTGGSGADIFEFKSSGTVQTDSITDYTAEDTLKFYLQAGESELSSANLSGSNLSWSDLTIAFGDTSITSFDDLNIAYDYI